jgi:hypothetical protein
MKFCKKLSDNWFFCPRPFLKLYYKVMSIVTSMGFNLIYISPGKRMYGRKLSTHGYSLTSHKKWFFLAAFFVC